MSNPENRNGISRWNSVRATVFFVLLLSLSDAARTSDDADRYAEVDRYALAAPSSVTRSIGTLAAYLARPFTDEEEKARAIFRWIAENISYDVEGYFSKRASAKNGDVLKSRSSVCAGYSSLFEALGRKAGLEVVTIDGFGKGFSYNPGDPVTDESNHAWNAVKIRGQWRLVDCTWGAGKVDAEHKFRKEFESYYFLARPEEFIYRHFPSDEKWQLLPRPVSRREFQDLPLVTPVFFQCGMSLAGRDSTVIDVNRKSLAEFSAPPEILCTVNLERDGKLVKNAVFLQRSGSAVQVRILPPENGDYFLNIFAGKGQRADMLPLAISFKVVAHSGAVEINSFPTTFKTFQETNTQLLAPLKGELPSGTMQVFSLISPGALKMAVVCDDEWDFLRKSGDQFEGTVEIGTGTMTVFAQYPGSSHFQALLEYTGTGNVKRAPAPLKYSLFIDSGAELFSPLKKKLRAGTRQVFRVKLPGASKAAVVLGHDWHFLEQSGDTFEGTIDIGAGKITVVGAYNNTTTFAGLLEYEGK
jgi:hypothetical protein